MVNGSCICGSVSVELNKSDVKAAVHCYCKNCQKLTGGGKSSNVLIAGSKVSMKGSLNTHSMKSDAGRGWTHVCCMDCGSSIVMINEESGDYVIRAGILDDSSWPNFISIFTKSAAPWDLPTTEIQFEGAVEEE